MEIDGGVWSRYKMGMGIYRGMEDNLCWCGWKMKFFLKLIIHCPYYWSQFWQLGGLVGNSFMLLNLSISPVRLLEAYWNLRQLAKGSWMANKFIWNSLTQMQMDWNGFMEVPSGGLKEVSIFSFPYRNLYNTELSSQSDLVHFIWRQMIFISVHIKNFAQNRIVFKWIPFIILMNRLKFL